ncbi:ABC transporter ATP-binding protein, putative [Babesia ovata]|uniref:ABC transporter ATP-binding protein, putative n=1 Tax=Babesia ovata TaxID=189622 RepID=A0A2H6KD54_9APIC|nr:ABC transporter ATP-binding protein, putative [Babesia ovata]GBE60923.1 ABC transporter ATP-binding protein, putative [Babesia ovata]
MAAVLDALLHSLGELSKRKVKRSAHIWSARLGEIYNRRQKISLSQVPGIVRCIVDNQLETHPKSKALLEHFVPLSSQLESLPAAEVAAICYAFSAIDEDATVKALLHDCWNRVEAVSDDLHGYRDLVRVTSLAACRQLLGGEGDVRNCAQQGEASELYERVIDETSGKIRTLQRSLNTSSIYNSVAGDLLVETVYLSNILKRNASFFNGSNRWIDFASIDGRIRISQLLSENHKGVLEQQIASASFQDTLSVLRHLMYMKHPHQDHIHQLFNRLCATSGKSTRMCRSEAFSILDYFMHMLQAAGDARVGTPAAESTQQLLGYLAGIRRTGVLSGGHISTHRWNYPIMLSGNG